jgi:hypothetical protein
MRSNSYIRCRYFPAGIRTSSLLRISVTRKQETFSVISMRYKLWIGWSCCFGNCISISAVNCVCNGRTEVNKVVSHSTLNFESKNLCRSGLINIILSSRLSLWSELCGSCPCSSCNIIVHYLVVCIYTPYPCTCRLVEQIITCQSTANRKNLSCENTCIVTKGY